jgi:hypothetical protein
MQRISPEEFKKKFGEESLNAFPQQNQPQASVGSNFISDVANQVKSNVNEASQSLNASWEGRMNPFAAGANIAKNVSGAILSPVSQALKPIFDKTLAPVTDAIVGTKPAQKLIDVLSGNPELVGAIADTLETALNAQGIEGTISSLRSGAGFVKSKAGEITPKIDLDAGVVSNNLKSNANNTSAGIMNRVARLSPNEETAFSKLSGKTPGEYLQETGNFGAPDKIIKSESAKFIESKNMVDVELAKLPGRYQDGAISDMLTGLYEKAQSVSGGNVKAPYLSQVESFLKKYNSGGLEMGEINAVKRLYERNVKLGYNKLMNADKVEQATNIDNSVRNWQVKQAEELGFNNIGDLNKQTQISKYLVDKLGNKVIGQSGLNSVSLTDWIVLSGGDVSSIAGFLTKRFFSSKNVQAKIAEILNSKEKKGIIKPNIGPSKVKALPAPSSGVRQSVGSGKPIRIAPSGSKTEIID